MTMYALMGLASWMVWTHGGFEQQKVVPWLLPVEHAPLHAVTLL